MEDSSNCIICQDKEAEISTECCAQPYCLSCLVKVVEQKNSCPTCRVKFPSMNKGNPPPQPQQQRVVRHRVIPSLFKSIRIHLANDADQDFKNHYGAKIKGKRTRGHSPIRSYTELVDKLACLFSAYNRGREYIFASVSKETHKLRDVNVIVTEVEDGILLTLNVDFESSEPCEDSDDSDLIPTNNLFTPKRKRLRIPLSASVQ